MTYGLEKKKISAPNVPLDKKEEDLPKAWQYLEADFPGGALVMKLHDGNCFLTTLKGKSERDPDNPANSRIHSAAWYEISDDRYRWMNNQIFMGYGRKEGANIHIDYYQVCD